MDSICSAIAYAHFKRQIGMPNAIAARCGDINDRIEFVLSKFGVAPPRFVADVRPRVRDVMQPHVIQVAPDTSACEALESWINSISERFPLWTAIFPVKAWYPSLR